MSLTLINVGSEKDISSSVEALRNSIAFNKEQPLPCVFPLRNAVVGWVPGPEVFLTYENNDCGLGAVGRVVILGYAVVQKIRDSEQLGQFLLNAWKDRGTEFLADLEGSFSLFMYDAQNEISIVATDPASTRPLWIAETSDGAVVSSDLRTLSQLIGSNWIIDRAYLLSFFSMARTVGNHSPFEGVSGVEPGQVVEFRDGGKTFKSYYMEPFFQPDSSRSIRETAGQLVECIRSTIEDLCSGSSSPCLFLSGGLDSRLIASLCPEGMAAVTLCDRVNREVEIARKIAEKCGLRHSIIKRNIDWYPSLMEKASLESSGLWSWTEAHFRPLADMHDIFPHDVVTLGFGADSYFKGLYLKDKQRLWQGQQNGDGHRQNRAKCLALVMDSRKQSYLGENVLRPEIRQDCRDAYERAVSNEIDNCLQWTDTLPDLWELYHTRSMVRVKEMMNLVCLRTFTSERNIFSSPRLRKLYLTIPPEMRASGRLVTEALKIVGNGLAWLPDASSWLPAIFPLQLHSAALQCRGHLSRARGAFLSKASSSNVSGHGAWQRLDRLFDTNEDVKNIITTVIEDNEALPDNIFDYDFLHKLWADKSIKPSSIHKDLELLISFGLFYKNWKSR
jgi:asparagine synthetase B (glutamine-hydrolysing)